MQLLVRYEQCEGKEAVGKSDSFSVFFFFLKSGLDILKSGLAKHIVKSNAGIGIHSSLICAHRGSESVCSTVITTLV